MVVPSKKEEEEEGVTNEEQAMPEKRDTLFERPDMFVQCTTLYITIFTVYVQCRFCLKMSCAGYCMSVSCQASSCLAWRQTYCTL